MIPFRLLIPVAPVAEALPRLEFAPERRAALSLAFAHDTIAAAKVTRTINEIVVVTSDPAVSELVTERRVRVVRSQPHAGLAEALAKARGQLESGSGPPTAVLVADLPALLPQELDEALRATTEGTEVCARDLGAGTPTLIACREGFPDLDRWSRIPLQRRWRENRGRVLPGLVCDVDTLEGLRIAAYLGVGRATTEVLRTLSLPRDSWGAA